MSQLRPRPRAINSADEFISGATDLDSSAPTKSSSKKSIDWGNEEVQCAFQLRLNKQMHNKLRFIANNTPACSIHSLIIEAVNSMIDERVGKLLKMGITPPVKEK
jgi:hypothetical protein